MPRPPQLLHSLSKQPKRIITSIMVIHLNWQPQFQTSPAPLVFTDPPYDKDSLPLYDQLGELAARILVDGGSLITYCGQYSMDQVMESLGKHLHFYWPLCCLHTGKTAQMKLRGIKVKWKPMLWFVKGTGSATHIRGWKTSLSPTGKSASLAAICHRGDVLHRNTDQREGISRRPVLRWWHDGDGSQKPGASVVDR